MLDIHAVDHHAAEQQHAVRWHLQVLEALAEVLAVVLDHFQCAAELRGAGRIRVIVGRVRAQGIAQFGVLLQPAQRLVPMLDESVAEHGVVAITDDVFEVGAHGLGGVFGTRVTGLIGAVQPYRTAGNRRGAAKAFGLFHDQHLQPAAGGGGSRSQAACATAQYHQVNAVLCVFKGRHGFRSPAASRP